MSTNNNPNSMDIKVKGQDARQFHNKNKRKYTDNYNEEKLEKTKLAKIPYWI